MRAFNSVSIVVALLVAAGAFGDALALARSRAADGKP
jgi:hypothetical protein